MNPLLLASLLVNVVVLVPICASLALDLGWVGAAYGPRHPGRQILLAVYAAILLLSLGLLLRPDEGVALGLLLAQIVYKVLTPLTVGTLRHPVVLSNLAIAALHGATAISLTAQTV